MKEDGFVFDNLRIPILDVSEAVSVLPQLFQLASGEDKRDNPWLDQPKD